MDEDDLIARLVRRDTAALAELYDRMGRRAFGLAYRVLDDGDAAEDVVQDAFIWVWEHADRLDARRGRVEPLLLTIVHRRAIDAVRARGRRMARSGAMPDDLADETAHGADLLSDDVALDQARRALNQLPGEQRDALQLAYFEGMTQQQIADRLKIPLGTVKSRLRLGLQKLRTALRVEARGAR